MLFGWARFTRRWAHTIHSIGISENWRQSQKSFIFPQDAGWVLKVLWISSYIQICIYNNNLVLINGSSMGFVRVAHLMAIVRESPERVCANTDIFATHPAGSCQNAWHYAERAYYSSSRRAQSQPHSASTPAPATAIARLVAELSSSVFPVLIIIRTIGACTLMVGGYSARNSSITCYWSVTD